MQGGEEEEEYLFTRGVRRSFHPASPALCTNGRVSRGGVPQSVLQPAPPLFSLSLQAPAGQVPGGRSHGLRRHGHDSSRMFLNCRRCQIPRATWWGLTHPPRKELSLPACVRPSLFGLWPPLGPGHGPVAVSPGPSAISAATADPVCPISRSASRPIAPLPDSAAPPAHAHPPTEAASRSFAFPDRESRGCERCPAHSWKC